MYFAIDIIQKHYNHPYDLIKECEYCNVKTRYIDTRYNLSCKCDCSIYHFNYNRKLVIFSRQVKDYTLHIGKREVYVSYNDKIIYINKKYYNLLPICCSNELFIKKIKTIMLLC